VRKVRLYKNTGHILADIYPVGKPLVDSLAPIHVAEVIRMVATTPPVTRLASAIKASTLSSKSNRFALLSGDDEDDDDDEQESAVSAPFAMCLEYLLLQHSIPTAQYIERTTPHPSVHREPSYVTRSDESYYNKSATP
jgi:hypothetical protein